MTTPDGAPSFTFLEAWRDEAGATLPPAAQIALGDDDHFHFVDPATGTRRKAEPHGRTLEEARAWWRSVTAKPVWPPHARRGT